MNAELTANDMHNFGNAFKDLTGHDPFPWQSALYENWFVKGKIPSVCNLPTGLGKTSVIAVWLVALANHAAVPRRLVYVVNRRTVVDQTTNEAKKLRDNASKIGIKNLAISTLRGQFADNREWSVDPSRPAVICGTVDMIGSRLLFSGYGIGFKSKPLHAGFLGQDVLLIHDEAHLEPAFQTLIETIQKEQSRCLDFRPLRVTQLTATTRNGDEQIGKLELTDEEKKPPAEIPDSPTKSVHHIWRRLKASKRLALTPVEDEKDAAAKIAEMAAGYKDENVAVLVFVRTLEAVATVEKELAKTMHPIALLTGTMRGKERDDLAERDPVFMRFLPQKSRNPDIRIAEGTVYLVCTSAGEVGVDISADHMVCDLATFESMAQRLGRVNRYGESKDTLVDVVHPTSFGKKDKKTGELRTGEIDKRRQKTLELLRRLPKLNETQYDASPLALSAHDADARLAAFAPEPVVLPATDILFDAWALTSIRQPMPGRPSVEPYLHGIAEWQPPDTYVAWRTEVGIIRDKLLEQYRPADLLDDYPLLPHELLRDATDRKNTGVFAQLDKMKMRAPEADLWIIDARGEVKTTKLREVIQGDSRRLHGATVILPPGVGGLTDRGTLDGDAPYSDGLRYDIADTQSVSTGARVRVWSDDAGYKSKISEMRRIRSIDLNGMVDEDEPRRWEWFESLPLEGGRTARNPVEWNVHVSDVAARAEQIVNRLFSREQKKIADAVILAAKLHDHGKRRERFQITLGNRTYPMVLWAKSGKGGARVPEPFRHEFASLFDAQADVEFNQLDNEMKDLVLHLIAAHHGRARPHFDSDEAFDPVRRSSDTESLALEVPRRFARLQRRYGRWGLAYLESLLRAADWAASDKPSAYADDKEA